MKDDRNYLAEAAVEQAASPEVVSQPLESQPRAPGRPGERIPWVVALGVALAWIVGLWVVFSLAPAPDPNEAPSLLGLIIGDLLWMSLLVGFVGMGMRRRWGLMASFLGGGVLLFGAVACQLTGHTGTWLAAQYVAGGSLAAFSWGGLKAS